MKKKIALLETNDNYKNNKQATAEFQNLPETSF